MSTPRPYIGGQAVLEGVMMRSPTSVAVVCRRRSGALTVREQPMASSRKGLRALPLVRGIASLVESLQLGTRALRWSATLYEEDRPEEEDEGSSKGSKGSKGATSSSTFAAALSHAGTLAALSLVSLLRSEPEPLDEAESQRAAHTTHTTHASTTTSTEASGGTYGQEVGADSKREPVAPASSPAGSTASTSSAGSLLAWLPMVFALLLFVALPQAAAEGVSRLFGLDLAVTSAPYQVITGVSKLCIVVGYLLLIRRIPDVRRVFQYHGAEHKTISTYEAGEELLVANARAKTTMHPRCGTTFLVMVALVSILMFTALGSFLPTLPGGRLVQGLGFFLMKLPFLPLIAAVTFEIQRLFARHCTVGPLRALLLPGFLVQRITTAEPDDAQLEVALASLRVTLWREASPSAPMQEDRSFLDYASLHADPGYAA